MATTTKTTKRTTKTTPKLKEAKNKQQGKPEPKNICLCSCAGLCHREFKMGHDQRAFGMLARIAFGEPDKKGLLLPKAKLSKEYAKSDLLIVPHKEMTPKQAEKAIRVTLGWESKWDKAVNSREEKTT